MYMKIAEKAK